MRGANGSESKLDVVPRNDRPTGYARGECQTSTGLPICRLYMDSVVQRRSDMCQTLALELENRIIKQKRGTLPTMYK